MNGLNDQSSLDVRKLISGKDGQLFVTNKAGENLFLAEVDEFSVSIKPANTDSSLLNRQLDRDFLQKISSWKAKLSMKKIQPRAESFFKLLYQPVGSSLIYSVNTGYSIREWSPILECIRWLENIKAQVGVTKKCRLLVTETNINLDVYLDSFDGNYVGGLGDYDYNISFVEGRDLAISSTTVETGSDSVSIDTSETVTRPESVSGNSYTVVSGDTLWGIAQRFLGSGGRYGEIYTGNQSTIDSWNQKYGNDKYTIYPGQVFTVG